MVDFACIYYSIWMFIYIYSSQGVCRLCTVQQVRYKVASGHFTLRIGKIEYDLGTNEMAASDAAKDFQVPCLCYFKCFGMSFSNILLDRNT